MVVTKKLQKLNKRLDRKWLAWNALIVGGFIFAVIMTGIISGMESVTNDFIFAPSVTVNGEQIGGMSYEEGLKTVIANENKRLNNLNVTVIYNGNEGFFTSSDLGVTSNAEYILRQAFNYNKDGTLIENFLRSFDDVQMKTDLIVDEQKLQNSLMSFLQAHYVGAAMDSSPNQQTFTYTEGQQVFAADLQEVVSQVMNRIENEDLTPVVI